MKAAWHVHTLAAALLLSSISAQAAAIPVPRAVVTDNARDARHPAANRQLLIPSGGSGMNALFFLAAGSGLKPTLLLLHGLPGNEQNLDLAQAIRRAGWNVLTMHYRGSWGSPGVFSIAHVLEDVDAAVAFVRQPDIAAKYGIDTHRIVLGGHSMGGFATAAHTRTDDHLLGAVLLDSWNAGATGDELGKESPAELEKSAPERFDDLGNSLHGATPLSTAKEVIAHRVDWNYLSWAKSLTHGPMLIVGASKAGGEQNRK